MRDLQELYEKQITSIKWAYLMIFLILTFGIYSERENEDVIVLLGILLFILETILFISHLKVIDKLKEVEERKKIEKENEEKRIRRALRKAKIEAKDD